MAYFLFLSFILRLLIIIFSLPIKNYDLNSYLYIGEKTTQLVNIYQKDFASLHYPYLPLFLYLEGLAYHLHHIINPILLLKLIINIFDLGNGILVYFLSYKNKKIFIAYLLNPISFLIFSFHGQFDSIPLFFTLLSIYILSLKKNEFLSAIFYSLAIAFKTWPIFFISPFLSAVKKKKLFISVLIFNLFIIIITYVILFKADYLKILDTVISYRSLFSHWGLGLIIKAVFFPHDSQPPIFLQKILIYFFLVSYFIYSIKVSIKQKKITNTIFNLLIFFYSFTFSFSPQYFSWFIPFIFLMKLKRWHLLLLIIITIYLSFNYTQWIFPQLNILKINQLLSILLWFFFIKFWLNKKIT